MTFTRNDEGPAARRGLSHCMSGPSGPRDRYALNTPAYVAAPLCMVPYRPARASVPE
jgi:hypothetical protein